MDLIQNLVSEAMTEWFGEKNPWVGSKPRRSLLLKGGGQDIEPHLHGKEGPSHHPIKITHHHLNKSWMSHHQAAARNAQADKHLRKIKKGMSKEARAKIHDHVQKLRYQANKWQEELFTPNNGKGRVRKSNRQGSCISLYALVFLLKILQLLNNQVHLQN